MPGVKFLQIGCNDTSAYVRVPPLFWWEGPDGSRILCNYTRVYGSGLMPPRDWPSKNYLAMIMTYDNQGPPSVGRRGAPAAAGRRKSCRASSVHFGTLDDFANAVIAENPNCRSSAATCRTRGSTAGFRCRMEAKAARQLPSARTGAGGARHAAPRCGALTTGDLAPALAEAYEQQQSLQRAHVRPFGAQRRLLEQRHAAIPLRRRLEGGLRQRGAYKKYEEAFDDKRAFAHRADEIVQPRTLSRLDLLAKSVQRRRQADRRLQRPAVAAIGHGRDSGRTGPVSLMRPDVPANGYKTYRRGQAGPSPMRPLASRRPLHSTRRSIARPST